MNIFAVDRDPVISAKSLCNTHVRKMFLESCNILLFPFKEMNFKLPVTKTGNEIRLSHRNHPATLWALSNYTNYLWLLTHTEELRNQCRARYKEKYYTEVYFNFIEENLIKAQSNFFTCLGSLTPFARCFGQFKLVLEEVPDTIEAYRKFYNLDKKDFAFWPSADSIPEWWQDRTNPKFVDKNFKDGDYTKR